MEEGRKPTKIRTMAQDLELAKTKVAETVPYAEKWGVEPKTTTPRPEPTAPAKEKRLSDILREAKERVGKESPLDAEQNRKQAKTIIPRENSNADILPIEENASYSAQPQIAMPPRNLPTGEPTLEEKKPLPEKEAPVPSDKTATSKKTPEDILGISKKASEPPSLKTFRNAEKAGVKQGELKRLKKPGLKPPKFKLFIIIGVLSAILLSATILIFWKISAVEETVPEGNIPPIGEQKKPVPLIAADSSLEIEINELSYQGLKIKLDSFKDYPLPPKNIASILIKYSGSYLTLRQFLQTLKIQAPPPLSSSEDFALFLYAQGAEEQKICLESGITSGLCFGNRVGLIIDIPENNVEIAKNAMMEWEPSLVEDVSEIIFAPLQAPNVISFSDGLYLNTATRFINLPIETISVDWMMAENKLIIATSKNAGRKARDNILP